MENLGVLYFLIYEESQSWKKLKPVQQGKQRRSKGILMVLKFLVLQVPEASVYCPPPPDFDCWHFFGFVKLILLLFFPSKFKQQVSVTFFYGIQNFLLITYVTIIRIYFCSTTFFLEQRYALFILFPLCYHSVWYRQNYIQVPFFPSQWRHLFPTVASFSFLRMNVPLPAGEREKLSASGSCVLMKQHSQAVVKIS